MQACMIKNDPNNHTYYSQIPNAHASKVRSQLSIECICILYLCNEELGLSTSDSFLLFDHVQSALVGKDNLPSVFPSLYPQNDTGEEICTAAAQEQEIFYSPLGEPDFKDLPSFAYQVSHGMVCAATFSNMQLKWCMIMFPAQFHPPRNTSPPWVSSIVTWPAATSWWMRGSCSRYQTLVSPETHPSMCPPSRTRCH